MNWKRTGLFAGGIVLGVIIIGLAAQYFFSYTFHGVLIRSDRRAPDFELTSAQTLETVKLSDHRGKVVLLYFGYTTCPDICPSTLTELGQVPGLLGRRADDVEIMWVTVDPERDTPEKVANYSAYFHPDIVGLVGTPEDIEVVALQFGVVYEKNDYGSAAGYLVDHTATVTMIDPEGYVKVVFPFGVTAEDIAADVNYVLTH